MHVPVCAVLCAVLLSLCCSVSEGQMVRDCCLSVKNKPVPKELVVGYSVQVGGQGCAIDATLLVTRQGRTLCVPPSKPWVKSLMRNVEKLKKHCQNNGYKGRRCEGVNQM